MSPVATPRLTFAVPAAGDADFFVRLNADPEVVRHTGDGPFADRADALAVIAILQDRLASTGMTRWVVRHEGAPIGWCGLKWREDLAVADLGYRFLQAAWGRGFATEASRAVLELAFGELGLPRVIADIAPENTRSFGVVTRLGFTRLGDAWDGELPVVRFERRRLCRTR